MDTEYRKQFLGEIKQLSVDGYLTEEQSEAIQDKYRAEAAKTPDVPNRAAAYGRAVAALLSLGVVVVLLAVIFLIGMSWTYMNSPIRVGVVGILTGTAYTAAFLINYRTKYRKTSAAVMILASLCLPLFLSVLITEFRFASALGNYGSGLFVSSITTVAAICVAYLVKNKGLAIIYCISLVSLYSFTLFKLDEIGALVIGSGSSVLWIPLAAALLIAAYAHQMKKDVSYASVLYVSGLLVLFSASMASVSGSTGHEFLWQAILIVECGLIIGLSIPLKSRVILVVGILFSFINLNQLYFTYFTERLWWPIGLSVMGILLIAAAFLVERNRAKIRLALGDWH